MQYRSICLGVGLRVIWAPIVASVDLVGRREHTSPDPRWPTMGGLGTEKKKSFFFFAGLRPNFAQIPRHIKVYIIIKY